VVFDDSKSSFSSVFLLNRTEIDAYNAILLSRIASEKNSNIQYRSALEQLTNVLKEVKDKKEAPPANKNGSYLVLPVKSKDEGLIERKPEINMNTHTENMRKVKSFICSQIEAQIDVYEQSAYGSFVISILDSHNPLALADGAVYKFFIDNVKEITLIAGQENTMVEQSLPCGEHLVSLQVWGYNMEHSKPPLHFVSDTVFKIQKNRSTKIVATRPGFFKKQALVFEYDKNPPDKDDIYEALPNDLVMEIRDRTPKGLFTYAYYMYKLKKNSLAQLFLAWAYYSGFGTEKNYEVSMQYFKDLADAELNEITKIACLGVAANDFILNDYYVTKQGAEYLARGTV